MEKYFLDFTNVYVSQKGFVKKSAERGILPPKKKKKSCKYYYLVISKKKKKREVMKLAKSQSKGILGNWT